MSQGLRMVHLRTVPDAWHAKVLAARLGCEGIVTHLQGNVSGPYPFGAVSVLVEADQADLAAELLLADEVEAAFTGTGTGDDALVECSTDDDFVDLVGAEDDLVGTEGDLDLSRHGPRSRWRRALAAAAVVVVAGAPVLAHFVSQ